VASPTPESRVPHIALHDVSKIYERGTHTGLEALRAISLDVARREFVSIVGPSGCGKSTLLKVIGGVVAQSRGRVAIDNDEERRKTIGFVFQTPVLLPWKSVLDNVMLPTVIQKQDAAAARKEADRLLSMVGLSEFALCRPYELSGGMQQRAAICRALMCKSDVLLMDEPFGALDALTRDDLAVELKRICDTEAKTVVFVTHSIPEAVFLGDRVVVMSPRPGRLQEIVDVNIDGRNDLAVMASPDFQELVLRIRRLIYAQREASAS
jgi:NitT/TauT family transport system ATP-binding protein